MSQAELDVSHDSVQPGDVAELRHLRDEINQAIAERERSQSYPSVRHPSYRKLVEAVQQFRSALDRLYGKHHPASDSGRADRAWAILDNAVFIGGAVKSGTGLVRNLLDGHPQLAVFVPEGALYRQVHLHAQSSLARRQDGVLEASFEQVVIGDLGGGPNWALSGGKDDIQPYLDFVTLYRQILEQLAPTDVNAIRAIVYAYLLARPGEAEQLGSKLRWVEKTPENPDYVEPLLNMFPGARFIFCLRDPRAITAGAKRRYSRKYGGFDLHWLVETSIRKTWAEMVDAIDRHGPQVCHAVRYEDLVTDPGGEMQAMAGFLGIDYDDALVESRFGGMPGFRNTGYGRVSPRMEVTTDSLDRWKHDLSRHEIDFVSSYVHPYAARFGYDGGSTSFVSYARAAFGLSREYRAQAGMNLSVRRAFCGWFWRQRALRPLMRLLGCQPSGAPGLRSLWSRVLGRLRMSPRRARTHSA